MAILIDGKQVAQKLRETVRTRVDEYIHSYGIVPHLTVILVGNDPASESYVRGKSVACEKAGIKSTIIRKNNDVTEAELIAVIDTLNADPMVHGILLQMPIPKHLDSENIINRIRSDKDVDGFTPTNVTKLSMAKPGLVPCTPLGVMRLLQEYGISLSGKNAVVIGRSQIVGKPMAALLLNENATVTICHSKTIDLPGIASRADILVAAIGKPLMIDDTYVKQGAVVIDVGISKVDGVIKGDVDFAKVEPKASFLTPVPGGVGPMTIACLLENTLTCYLGLVN